ncbi:MAG: hypothetical protein FVQ81_13130 [Candidatus Glassbacteria bacterium]|nr:hypothetical protein [Candidatus Glassbacteria bacterium]
MKALSTPHLEHVEVSAHAVDRASLRCLGVWRDTAKRGEGLHSWLERQAKEALCNPADHKGRHMHLGFLWAFHDEEGHPKLMSLIQDGK